MTDPPNLNYIPTSSVKINEIFDTHRIEEKLTKCNRIEKPIPQSAMHEQFCCTQKIVYYVDPDTDDEVARFSEYSYRDRNKGNSRMLLSLRIGTNVYKLELD